MQKDYVEFYNKITKPYINNPFLLKLFKIVYKVIPFFIAASYLVILISLYCKAPFIRLSYKDNLDNIFYVTKGILTPLTAFIFLSVIRKCIDAKRPYELYAIKPLIVKNKKGESMPSRHILSITIISMVCLYANVYLGILFFALSILLAYIRVVAGVHFTKDVVVGFIFAVIWGYIGLFIL